MAVTRQQSMSLVLRKQQWRGKLCILFSVFPEGPWASKQRSLWTSFDDSSWSFLKLPLLHALRNNYIIYVPIAPLFVYMLSWDYFHLFNFFGAWVKPGISREMRTQPKLGGYLSTGWPHFLCCGLWPSLVPSGDSHGFIMPCSSMSVRFILCHKHHESRTTSGFVYPGV